MDPLGVDPLATSSNAFAPLAPLASGTGGTGDAMSGLVLVSVGALLALLSLAVLAKVLGALARQARLGNDPQTTATGQHIVNPGPEGMSRYEEALLGETPDAYRASRLALLRGELSEWPDRHHLDGTHDEADFRANLAAPTYPLEDALQDALAPRDA